MGLTLPRALLHPLRAGAQRQAPLISPFLVPKLRLGTSVLETPFPPAPGRNGVSEMRVPKRSLGTRRREKEKRDSPAEHWWTINSRRVTLPPRPAGCYDPTRRTAGAGPVITPAATSAALPRIRSPGSKSGTA